MSVFIILAKVNEMSHTYLNFGDFLQKKREENRITIRNMAERIGISPTFLCDIERDRRNPPEKDKLDLIANALNLTSDEITLMMNLAGKKRNTVAPDLPEYIMGKEYVVAALRTARDLNADESDWLRFVEELRNRKGY